MKDKLYYLRLAAFAEGISLLVLLFVAMPLKYAYGMPKAVSVVGMTHGILFMIFVVLLMSVSQRHAWSDRFSMAVLVSSMIPFGTFYMDRRLKALAQC